jgi:hypothetical protein
MPSLVAIAGEDGTPLAQRRPIFGVIPIAL